MTDLDFKSETINLTEAAVFLQISEDTLINLARAGKVPACKIGRRWVFMRSLLMEYVRCRGENLDPATAQQRRLR
jgi:putative molybdopterin biosynthesis protein